MRAKTNNIEITMGSETHEIVKELFESLLQKHQEGLEDKMKGSEFVFDSINLLRYNLQKISLNRGGSNIDFPKWLKIKKATINLKNNDDKCFQYAVTAPLNYEQNKAILKQYKKSSLLLNSVIGKNSIFHHIK